MKTSELKGRALDWAVGTAENHLSSPRDTDWYCPSSSWAQGGPIIEREKISIIFHDGFYSIPNTWFAYQEFYYDGIEVTTKNDMQGNTPLIAAMRCYVSSKLGDEVDVPKELL